jgi:RimJ/RimL family protein N-acetyltransferase
MFALAFAENAASTRVLEKAGYVREGVLRSGAVKHGRVYDQLLYAKVNPSWRGVE